MVSLSLKNITKIYQGRVIIKNVSLTVKSGDFITLFGQSGAGKSLILRLISGFVEPDEGSIAIDGDDLSTRNIEERGIGMAFQNFALFPHMDAFANIASPLRAQRLSCTQIKLAVEDMARLLKIDHILDHRPHALSNGQKQRVSLARALIGAPALLLLDDPLRNLDAKLRFEMRLELPRLLKCHGTTVIYVTQDYREAMAFGGHSAVLVDGQLRQVAKVEEIYRYPADLNVARLFGDPPINILPVIVKSCHGRASITLEAHCFELPNIKCLAGDRDCLLGIRPEALYFTQSHAKIALPVSIVAQTPLNDKIISLVKTEQGNEILLSHPDDRQSQCQGSGFIGFDPKHILLFNCHNGERMEL